MKPSPRLQKRKAFVLPLCLFASAVLASALQAQSIQVVETTADQTQLLAPQPSLSFAAGTSTSFLPEPLYAAFCM